MPKRDTTKPPAKCARPNCHGTSTTAGLCHTHYASWRKLNPVVAPDVVGNHIDALIAAGMSWSALVRATGGMQIRSLQKLAKQKYVTKAVADRVLRVPIPDTNPGPPPPELLDGNAFPLVGVARRLQALVAIGYSNEQLSAEIGYHQGRLAEIIYAGQRKMPRSYVYAATARDIVAAFDRLENIHPGDGFANRRARLRARRNGWAPPLAWDPETIDDPNAVPAASAEDLSKHRIPDDFADIIADHRELGRTDVDIAAHFGLTLDALQARYRRVGIPRQSTTAEQGDDEAVAS